jgi:uncharacterized iron-regulated membrane protein
MLLRNKNTGKTRKPAFRKISEWLHLWLGLLSGIIVFVVCLTGAIWVWRYEVWNFTEPYQRISPQDKAMLIPSQLIAASKRVLFAKEHQQAVIGGLTFGSPSKAVIVSYRLSDSENGLLYVNPYNGIIIKDKREASAAEKFFIFIRAGHRFFWLPKEIGSPLVGASCIIFLLTLITGLIWWFPVKWTKKTREKSFKIRWDANWKRLNIDLHNVLGFYALIFIFLLTASGVVFTFKWFEHGVYKMLTWKNPAETKIKEVLSDTTMLNSHQIAHPEDLLWKKINAEFSGQYGKLAIDFPVKAKDPYEVIVQFGDGTIIYNNVIRYYDQQSLKQIKTDRERLQPYANLSSGEKAFRMNFDIHTGQILGLPSKIIAFLASMIGASLPVTGFIIWYNRKWGKNKKKSRRMNSPG